MDNNLSEYVYYVNQAEKNNDYSLIACIDGYPYDSKQALKDLWHKIPDNQKYRVVKDVYKSNGYNFPKKYITECKKIKPSDYLSELPDEYKKENTLIVYRASTTPPTMIDKLKNELSWTISYDKAKWFYNRHLLIKRPAYIYKGSIKLKDIIMYSNERQESEVIQYRNVIDVQCIIDPDKNN